MLALFAEFAEPASIEFDVETADEFLERAPAELDRLGIDLIEPERLVRAGIDVRGRATPAPARRPGGRLRAGGHRRVVDRRRRRRRTGAMSAAEIARAEAAGATLLHTGRRWVRIDPAALRRARRRLEDQRRDHERVDALTLARLAGESEIAGAGELDGRPARRTARRATDRDGPGRRPSSTRCVTINGAPSAGSSSWTDWASAGVWPTTWVSARPPPRSPTCSSGRGPISWSVRCRSCTTGSRKRRFRRPSEWSCTTAPASVRGDGDGVDDRNLAAADLVVTTYGLLPDLDHLAMLIDWSTVVLDGPR